jgi:hypothetical protein
MKTLHDAEVSEVMTEIAEDFMPGVRFLPTPPAPPAPPAEIIYFPKPVKKGPTHAQ